MPYSVSLAEWEGDHRHEDLQTEGRRRRDEGGALPGDGPMNPAPGSEPGASHGPSGGGRRAVTLRYKVTSGVATPDRPVREAAHSSVRRAPDAPISPPSMPPITAHQTVSPAQPSLETLYARQTLLPRRPLTGPRFPRP